PLIESLTPPAFPTVSFSGFCNENFLDCSDCKTPAYNAESLELTDSQHFSVASIPSSSSLGLGGSPEAAELLGAGFSGTAREVSRFLIRSPSTFRSTAEGVGDLAAF